MIPYTSVTVLAEYRRRGYASAMLREYVQQVLATTTVYRLRLLSKAYLLGFYQSCGFIFLRVSPVQHGQETWFELGLGELGCWADGSGRRGGGGGKQKRAVPFMCMLTTSPSLSHYLVP